jgi:hypothetical protein
MDLLTHFNMVDCKPCVLLFMLEHQALMVHHTSPGFSRSRGRPTSGYSRSGDRPTHHTSRSSSRRACRSDSRPTIKDSRVVDRPTQQSTTSWMHSRSGRVLSSRLDRADFVESTLTTDGYMWTRSSRFYGSWLDIETIKEDPLGHYQQCELRLCNRSCGSRCAICTCDVLITVHSA